MICGNCSHEESDHCEGNQVHTDHKEDSRMVEPKWRKNTHVCSTRHCLAALCCCTAFVPTVAEPTGFSTVSPAFSS